MADAVLAEGVGSTGSRLLRGERSGFAPLLREDATPPPERLLQLVWFHQRILRDKLLTAPNPSADGDAALFRAMGLPVLAKSPP